MMKAFIMSLSILFLLTSCNERPDKGMVGEKPPNAMVKIDNQFYETTLGTYCWSTKNQGLCVDTIGPVELLEGKEPISVKPGDAIKLVMDYEPLPNQFHVTQISGDKRTEVELKGSVFSAPTKKGIYYYHYGVWWMDEKVENLSNGSAFYNFVIEIN